MDAELSTHNPFAVLTFIVAPAMLTNASSVLALSTINRMLRTRDRMTELFGRSEAGEFKDAADADRFVAQVTRVEEQAVLLLRALRSIYVSLGAFISATLVTLLGAVVSPVQTLLGFRAFGVLGLAAGCIGVIGLVHGCSCLLRATQLSLIGIREEAALIRARQADRLRRVKGQTRP